MLGLVIGVFIVLALIFLINGYQNKYQSFQGTVFNFIIVVMLLFLVLSVGYVYLGFEGDISTFAGFLSFFKLYFAWVADLVKNLGNITGYVVQQDWGAINSTG